MIDYLYDGSFDGLLTAVYASYYEEKAQGIFPQAAYQNNFFVPSRTVETDLVKAEKVYHAIERKISDLSLKHIFYTYLSNEANKETKILNYLQLGFKLGRQIDDLHAQPEVLPIRQTARKVSFEAERFLGLLRFKDTGSFLYAVLEPDHHILILLADHFADRLAQERFIIHDRKRGLAVVSNCQDWYITDFPEEIGFTYSEQEKDYQELWRLYFSQISIENRKNKKLQTQFVPHRYRRHLTEFTTGYSDKNIN
ncbi:TIGR03915 family putative DNA repair protein [Dehalobacter sp. DCM]|uniref:TIGR03915 family putative DNA repair protein n=1 Tax=Dehalobacter sp. DCM TaxID=2907827 RepID=UPI003081A552|nr:TIGR03915 family putative DNA repair protein [Dehalobacter sp. DCM]